MREFRKRNQVSQKLTWSLNAGPDWVHITITDNGGGITLTGSGGDSGTTNDGILFHQDSNILANTGAITINGTTQHASFYGLDAYAVANSNSRYAYQRPKILNKKTASSI